jgi:hypothetical protein
VILVSEASARPAQNRDLHFLQRFNYVITHTVGVGNIGILTDINTFVNTSAQVLREMSLDLRIDVAKFFSSVDK